MNCLLCESDLSREAILSTVMGRQEISTEILGPLQNSFCWNELTWYSQKIINPVNKRLQRTVA